MAVTSASPSLSDALVILGAAGIVIPLFARFRITPVIGFILVGVAVGPFGLGQLVHAYPWLSNFTITEPKALAPYAEFGIILLLFSIGMELSFDRLWAMRRAVFGFGALELLVSAALLTGGLAAFGLDASGAVAVGLALAMSSTALVLRIVDRRTAVGSAALGMLLFEDLALVPIIFLLGAMAPHEGSGGFEAMIRTAGLGLLVVLVLLACGRLLLPRLFAQAARTKSPELFLAASLIVVIASAMATTWAGLSPIVGALIAGLLIAETEYEGEVAMITAPFQGLALGVFLLTVGMSLDMALIWANFARVMLAVGGVLLLKALVTGLLLRIMGERSGTATETGILMASPSETTLIVLAAAASASLIAPDVAQFWQIVTAIGLTVTPLLAMIGRRLARRVDHAAPAPFTDDPAVPRAIIIGCGRVGRLVADMLSAHGKPYVAIDSNPDLISAATDAGYRAMFGDAARGGTMTRLGVDHALAVILTMDDPVGAQQMVTRLRTRYPDLPIIARARDTSHAAQLYKAGASHAVPETLESSLQLSEAVLVDLGVPMGPVIASIHEKRDLFRAQIMEEGDLTQQPMLKSGGLRDRAG
jgi:monovalent cation:H+ antiporter-2, CPA2 family